MSLNIAHGRKKAAHQLFLPTPKIKKNLSDIAELIKREGPDIVALQEVDIASIWNGGFNHLEYLKQESDYPHSAYGIHASRLKLAYGTALLSQHSLRDSHSIPFQSARLILPKGFLVSSFLWPGADIFVDIVSLHLDFARAQVRQKQVEQLIDILKSRGRPVVVTGDFNSDWKSENSAVRHISKALDLNAFEPDSRAHSTFRATQKRWDWILASSAFEFIDYRVLSEVLSDHSTVMARIGLKSD